MDKYKRNDMEQRSTYCKERDEAFLSLDEKKIRAFCKKYQIYIPESEVVFWAGVHKAICNMNAASVEQKINSLMWLTEHGFRPEINFKGR